MKLETITHIVGNLQTACPEQHTTQLYLSYMHLSPTSDVSRPLIGQLARVYDLLSPTSDVSRPLIGQLARVYDIVCRGKSCMSG